MKDPSFKNHLKVHAVLQVIALVSVFIVWVVYMFEGEPEPFLLTYGIIAALLVGIHLLVILLIPIIDWILDL